MKRSDVTIGVGIPSYNHGRYIGEALRCMLTQTWLPDIVDVIDDGSSDGSVEEIARAFEDRHGPVESRLLVRENCGISEIRNELIARLKTDVLALLDSDDYYREDRLERMLSPVPAGETFFAVSGVAFQSELDGRLRAVLR
jgi:glycosyltransferase involved in cell wall biosynthesis